MKLLINLSNHLGGGGLQVALSFLSECRQITNNEYHVFMSPNVARQVDRTSFGKNFFFYDIPSVPFWKLSRVLSPLEKQIRPDAVFTVFGPSYWRPKSKHLEGFARGYWIYPESSFFKMMDFCWKISYHLQKNIKLFFFKKEADAYVVETDDANKRVRTLLGFDPVYTVSNTCGAQYFQPEPVAKKLPERQPDEFRLLTVSAYYLHKNLEIIPSVIDILNNNPSGKNIRFVLTLKPEDYQKIIPLNYRDQVHNTGPVPAKECPSLYRECDAMFLPTLLECFSANYPEAMAMELPILTSDLDFAHSICRDAALYFNPVDPKDAADKILKLAEDKLLRKHLAEKGKKRLTAFPSAQKRAEHYLELCKMLSENIQNNTNLL